MKPKHTTVSLGLGKRAYYKTTGLFQVFQVIPNFNALIKCGRLRFRMVKVLNVFILV